MNRRRTGWSEERVLVLVGLIGLGAAAYVACGGDDDDSPTKDAGANDSGEETKDSGSVVTADCESSSSTKDNTAAVVTATNTFLDALTEDQRTKVKYDKTLKNAQQWSNFPTTFVQRNGVTLGDMSDDAQKAAVALAEAATGSAGAKLLSELREADEWLVTDGKASSTDYGRGLYYFSIHGTPSTSAAWMLQIAGHHLAYNFMYNGKCTSATPLFEGAEPMDWTDGSTKHSPLETLRSTSIAVLASVGSMSSAKLSGTFGDLINGPSAGGGMPGGGMSSSGSSGNGDTKYPSSLTYPTGTSGRGVAVKSLTSAQKDLVKKAIEAWVKNAADPVSSALLAEYESDASLDDTYVGYSGSADLSTQASYFRIDGPRVWIEASVQGGIVYRNIVHFHTIWRDKAADYGAEFISQ